MTAPRPRGRNQRVGGEAKDDSFFRTLIEKSADAICLVEAGGRILYANPSTRRILDYDPAALAGADGWEIIHPDDRAMAAAVLEQLLAEAGTSVTMTRFRLRHRDGSYRWMETVATNLLEEPAVRAILCTYRDVTGRVRLEEQLQQAQKMEAIGLLAGGVAHDFNNLLTVVLAAAEHARMILPPDHAALEDLTSIGQAALSGRDVTRKLLAFSQRPGLTAEVFDLRQLLRDFTALLGRIVGEDIVVDVSAPAEPLPIEGNHGQLQQLLLNLCTNARQAMPAGGHLRLAIARAPDPRRCVLEVADSGTGMDEQTRARLFEPFFTTRPGGTGLGMAVVFGVVRDHRGTIQVDSTPGAGTTVRIELPLATTPARMESGEQPGPEIPHGKETLLLAEDEPLLRQMMARMLRRFGYSVLTAADGQEALEVLERETARVALVVLDVIMPRLGGQQAFVAMQALRPDLKAVFVSGYAPEATGLGALLATGRCTLIQKPFLAPELAAKVRALLDGP
jgi:two-component system cell cycle sensor histidine kinase/response regulator CckA